MDGAGTVVAAVPVVASVADAALHTGGVPGDVHLLLRCRVAGMPIVRRMDASGGPPAQAWCCRHGVELSVAVLPVETFTGCHDGLRDMMEVVMREAGTDVRSEPGDIFASLIDPRVLARPGQSPAIRPDLQATLSMPAAVTARGQRARQPLPARRLLFAT